ncbi:tetratricopeptide repeat protein [Microvirga sp. 2MCAF38]|uniref:tetratricopeptide repeat protein n=1 Tax=Microvirga sp. 2MCAF38 TaxID=3232989 RepID=UPI003F95E102
MPLIRGIIATLFASAAFSASAQTGGGNPNLRQATTPVLTNGVLTAQAPAPTTNPPGASPTAPQSAPIQVDESALRYFAAQGDTRRVDAEIARLRALYPNWTPPTDLTQLSTPSGPQPDAATDKIWALYAEGRIAEARAAIADRSASEPQWKPPADLISALDVAEARIRLTNASDNSQWRTVLSIATETPTLLTCANVDALWRVAEAFSKTNQASRTKDVYTYILSNCNNRSERLATLQKAVSLLPEAPILDLLKFERKTGTDQDDFSEVRDELARKRVERASTDPKLKAAPEDLAVVERLAEGESAPGNALLLGWYNYHHAQPEKARDWFKIALDRDGGAKAAEGLALSLRALNQFVPADAIAYEWHDKSKDNLSVYLDVITALLSQDPPLRVDPEIIARSIPVITRERFSNGGQALGWYSYNTNQFRTARDWFMKALSWKPDDEPSAYGLALSYQRLNDRTGFASIANAWRARSQQIADLADGRPGTRLPVESQPLTPSRDEIIAVQPRAEPIPQPRAAPTQRAENRYPNDVPTTRANVPRTQAGRGAKCTGTGNPHALSPDAAVTLGWCLMELNRPLEAVTAFDQAIKRGNGRTRQDAAYGKSLAYLRKDLTSQAAIAAAEAPQEPRRQVELSATILAQRAVAAYRAGRFVEVILALGERARIVPEQNDLMLLRGWSYFKLGRYDDAKQVFQAVQRTGFSNDANVGLNAILEATQPIRQY